MDQQEQAHLPLDEHVELLEAREEAWLARDAWDKRLKEIDKELQDLIGDAAGTFQGAEVVTYNKIARISESRFRAEQPEMAQHFTVPRVTEVIDLDRLRRTRPDLYGKYQVRQMRFNYQGRRHG